MFPLTDPPEYEPDVGDSVSGLAQRAGVEPAEWAYDFMLGDGGSAMFYVPFLNYADGNLDTTREMLAHPRTVPGLSDGGAHAGTICDGRSEEHTSELQSLMRHAYAVFCLQHKKQQ